MGARPCLALCPAHVPHVVPYGAHTTCMEHAPAWESDYAKPVTSERWAAWCTALPHMPSVLTVHQSEIACKAHDKGIFQNLPKHISASLTCLPEHQVAHWGAAQLSCACWGPWAHEALAPHHPCHHPAASVSCHSAQHIRQTRGPLSTHKRFPALYDQTLTSSYMCRHLLWQCGYKRRT